MAFIAGGPRVAAPSGSVWRMFTGPEWRYREAVEAVMLLPSGSLTVYSSFNDDGRQRTAKDAISPRSCECLVIVILATALEQNVGGRYVFRCNL